MKKNIKFLTAALFASLTFGFLSCGDDDDDENENNSSTVIEADEISFESDSQEAVVGEGFQLKLTVSPSGASLEGVKYTSSDESVATVDEDGYVTCIAEGSSVIKAVLKGVPSATCTVTVTKSEDEGENTGNTEIEETSDLLIYISDVFKITGYGPVVTGTVTSGTITAGQTVRIYDLDGNYKEVTVEKLELYREQIESAVEGNNIGIALDSTAITTSELSKGMTIVATNSIYEPSTEFTGKAYILSSDEGGRKTPIANGYMPQLYYASDSCNVTCTLAFDAELCMPGDSMTFSITTVKPIIVRENDAFNLREGGRTVGSGTFTTIK